MASICGDDGLIDGSGYVGVLEKWTGKERVWLRDD